MGRFTFATVLVVAALVTLVCSLENDGQSGGCYGKKCKFEIVNTLESTPGNYLNILKGPCEPHKWFEYGCKYCACYKTGMDAICSTRGCARLVPRNNLREAGLILNGTYPLPH